MKLISILEDGDEIIYHYSNDSLVPPLIWMLEIDQQLQQSEDQNVHTNQRVDLSPFWSMPAIDNIRISQIQL